VIACLLTAVVSILFTAWLLDAPEEPNPTWLGRPASLPPDPPQEQAMRFKIVFSVNDDEEVLAVLEDSQLGRAIEYARRIAEGGFWKVIDTFDGEVMAASDSGGHQQRKDLA
jgi:hypothetical protein